MGKDANWQKGDRMETNERRYIQIGLKIAYYRRLHNLTQEQLADIIGISPGYLSQIETPSHPQPLSLKTLFAIADYFKVAPKVFLDFIDE